MTTAAITAGDVILTGKKSQGAVSVAIKIGEALRGHRKEARFSHCLLALDSDGTLIEAAAKGVRVTSVGALHEGDWEHIPVGVAEHDMRQIRVFCDAVLEARWKYGFATFAGLALYCLTGGQLCVQKAGTAICSGLVAEALTRAGVVWERPPYACMPADIYEHFKAVSGR